MISVYYYLRVAKAMYRDLAPEEEGYAAPVRVPAAVASMSMSAAGAGAP